MDPLDVRRRQAVLSELERIVESPAFKGSRRSQDFLRYVILARLDGHLDQLKERAIGAEVFGRDPDYDTGGDSIVRVKANEVRKRLAQFYKDGPAHEVHVELPAGSYAPEFVWPGEARSGAPPAAQPPRKRFIALAVFVGLAAVAGAGVFIAMQQRPARPFEEFWQPVMSSRKPVLLCVAHPVVHHLRGKSLVSESPMVPRSDITRDPDHYLGVGDALSLARFSAFFASRGKTAQVRIGTETTYAELRDVPAVFIGAFTNQWTMQLARDFRFVFERDDKGVLIRDQQAPGQRWVFSGDPSTDYAIISRVFDSKTGDLLVVAAGLGHFGTQVAGEFLTNEAYLGQALESAPPDWRRRNVQFVIRGEVIGKTTGPPKVAASHFW
ncbi:MAG TPA: hypothetical protein DEH78_21205 [Solibacterales bacterium]|nr:hypothetical protein [Bryobacterales bacterium]